MQILPLVVGFRYFFANFVRGGRGAVFFARTLLLDNNSEGIMVTEKIGRHKVEIYDSIDDLPIVRFHKYQKLLLIDAGIGSDIAAFDKRTERLRRLMAKKDWEGAGQELLNLRQCVYLTQQGLSMKDRAFAVLVAKIDGKPREDISDEGLERTLEELRDLTAGRLGWLLQAVKKKIDTELTTYFPALFSTSELKEYYDLMRARALAILEAIVAGEARPDEVEKVDALTGKLIIYSNPRNYAGSQGAEVRFDREFEDLCLVLSERLHVEPKKYSVLEFYNAFEFVRERAKEAENAYKGGKYAR